MKLYCHQNSGEVLLNCTESDFIVIATCRRWIPSVSSIEKFGSNKNAVVLCSGCARTLTAGILTEVFMVFLGLHINSGMLIPLIRPQGLPNPVLQ